jgi:uncharacterized phage protein (TIGR02218 family)
MMADFLAGELLTVALCWRLERRDGVVLGFTTHDRNLRRDGLTYQSAPGMLPSSISVSDGFDADSLDMKGALTSDAITAADLTAGHWDGASIQVFMVDWEAPAGDILPLARGELGEVSTRGNAFEAALRSPVSLLDAPVAEQTSPGCRAQLGDSRCRIDMAGRTRLSRIVSAPAADTVEVSGSMTGDAYGFGRLRWLGGPNSGLENRVLRSDGPLLILDEPPAFEPVTGDLIQLSEGCDGTLATCAGRFGNVLNFRGEPHLPGIDLLTRYPGA